PLFRSDRFGNRDPNGKVFFVLVQNPEGRIIPRRKEFEILSSRHLTGESTKSGSKFRSPREHGTCGLLENLRGLRDSQSCTHVKSCNAHLSPQLFCARKFSEN